MSTGNPRATLAAACVVGPLMTLVVTGPSVAIPDIGADLGSSLSAAQWVVDGYMLTASSSLAAMGSLADRVGHRRMFTWGMAFFAFWMTVSGLANSILVLDLARAVAGFGSGAALASITAILAQAFDGPARAKAFGLFGTFLGAGLAFGPAFGGALVNLWGWRSVFLVLAAVSALVLLSTPLLPRSEPVKGSRFDWTGSLLFALGVALFVLALVEGPGRGWTDPLVLAAAGAFLVLMAAFVRVERRTENPMFDLGLFARPQFLAVCLVPLVLAFSFVALVIVLPPYLTSTSGMSALRIGLVLLLLTGPSLVMPALTGLVVQKVSQRTLFVVLLACSAAGAAWLTFVDPGPSALALAGPLLLLGIGYGISLGILDGAAVSAVEPERMGMAAGMFNTVRLTSDAVSMAGLGTLVTAITKSALDKGAVAPYPGGADALTSRALQGGLTEAVESLPAGAVRDRVAGAMSDAYASGLHTTMWLVAAACAVSAVLVGMLLSDKRQDGAGDGTPAESADPAAASPEPASTR
ncbi:MFS transporter [Streptomyces sp. SBST2-5]|uniref:MFS transporter n=1 Tax=Streptomyces composti TaxID=2720025 RepID=A0ABX1A432_9ACTN|nr:MFS transporter [Streptomyces composti]NJP51184.1 MFS transporter [Streptomyces composti]